MTKISPKDMNNHTKIYLFFALVGKFLTCKTTRGVSQCGLAIYIKKHLKGKEELWKIKYFTMQKYSLQKIL